MKTNGISLYPYRTSKAAAVISIIVFCILLAVHAVKLFKTKMWFTIPFLLCTIFEILGYLARAYGHSHPSELNPYVAQALLILLAPILLAAAIYMFLGRIVLASGHTKACIVRPTWLTKIFVGGDVLCFLVQAAGAAMLTKTDATQSTRDLGKYVVLAGLIIQLFVLAFFVVVAAVFHVRARKAERSKRALQSFNWQGILYKLYVVSGLITIRNVFRVAEYVGGEKGYLLAHEWPMYIFDALLVAISMAICTTWYVSDIAAKSNREGNDADIIMMPLAGRSEPTWQR